MQQERERKDSYGIHARDFAPLEAFRKSKSDQKYRSDGRKDDGSHALQNTRLYSLARKVADHNAEGGH